MKIARSKGMLFLEPLKETYDFVKKIRSEINERHGPKPFSNRAIDFICFCITGIIVTGTISWTKFEKASGGLWKQRALSWFLHRSTFIPWSKILSASAMIICKSFGVKEGILVIDDFDRHRSKSTTNIFGVHKVKNKKGGGFVSAQNVVLLVLVTKHFTIPVAFEFYLPDPDVKAWRKEDEKLRKKGVPKALRPPKPLKNRDYPTKKEQALRLVRQFRYFSKGLMVKAYTIDSAFMSKEMRDDFRRIYPDTQLISQLRFNQLAVFPRRKNIGLEVYFSNKKSITKVFNLRSGNEKTIIYKSERLFIKSHSRVYHIVVFKYEGEEKYRYICATNLTWRAEDIIRAYAFRWLIEVVIEDSKLYAGFGQVAMQQGEDGARRAVGLSLLLDHFLISHPEQQRLHRAGQPLRTVASMQQHLQLQALFRSIEKAIDCPDPKASLRDWMQRVRDHVELKPSRKHMAGMDLGWMAPSPSLSKKFKNAS